MAVTLEEIKQKQTELEAMIKAYEEQEEAEAEFPQNGETYYYTDGYGIVAERLFHRTIFNNMRLSIGNCFRTKEEAEFAVEQLKVIAELKKCGGVWGTPQKSNTAIWLNGFGRIKISDYYRQEKPTIYFSSKAQAQKALETIGADRLMRYWFNVGVEL